MGCTFSGSPQTPPLPTLFAWQCTHLCYLGDPKDIWVCTACSLVFLAKHISVLFQNGPVENWLDFPGKNEWLIKLNLTLERFNSFREVPPSIALFRWTKTLRDALLRKRDPYLEKPLLPHLHAPQVCYASSSLNFFSQVTGLISFNLIYSLRMDHPVLPSWFSPYLRFSNLLVQQLISKEMPDDSSCHQDILKNISQYWVLLWTQ